MKRLLLTSFLFLTIAFNSMAQWLPCVDAALITGTASCAVVDSVYGCDMVVYNCADVAIYNNGITHFTHDPYPYITNMLPCHSDFSISESAGVYSFNDTVGYSVTGSPTYTWDFGDGNLSSDPVTTTHTYSAPGYYTVCVMTDDNSICESKSCRVILVSGGGGCVPAFSDATYCGVTTFTDLTTPANYSYAEWDFGDLSTTTAAPGNITHTYTASGTYLVMLTVYDSIAGCSAVGFSDSVTVTIPTVDANFTYTASGGTSAPYTVTFTNTSTDAISYAWDFGDGDTSSLTNPIHDYDTCSYTVKLTAMDANGCFSEIEILIDACNTGISTVQSTIQSMSVYPNPAKENINLAVNSIKSSNVQITLKDVTGRDVIDAKSFKLNAGKNNLNMNLPVLASGVYMIQVKDNNSVFNSRILIK